MMRFGRWAPTPRITDRINATSHLTSRAGMAIPWRVPPSRGARCLLGLAQLTVQRFQVGGQPLEHIALGHVVADFDGAGEPEGIDAAVALDGDAIEAEKRSTVEPARIHPLLQAAQARLRQEGPEPGRRRAG